MGGTSSKNIVESTTNSFINVINESTQECRGTVNQGATYRIKGIKGGDINVGEINFRQAATIDTACYSKNNVQNNIENNIKQLAEQIATSINTSLNLNPSSTKAENVTRYVTNMGLAISNAYRSECSNRAAQAQTVELVDAEDIKFSAAVINFDQFFQSISNCIQENETVNQAKNDLEQTINQEAVVERKGILDSLFGGLFSGIFGIIIIIVVIIVILAVVGGVIYFIVTRKKQLRSVSTVVM